MDIELSSQTTGLTIWKMDEDSSHESGTCYQVHNKYNFASETITVFFHLAIDTSLPTGTCTSYFSGTGTGASRCDGAVTTASATTQVTTETTAAATQAATTTTSTQAATTQAATTQVTTETTTAQVETVIPTTTEATETSTETQPGSCGGLQLDYDYCDVINKSILFYETQRSGVLPSDNRISYRGNSATSDGSDVNLDLTGGWYDAGDHVKFNFPMAASTTVLACGMAIFRDAYAEADQLTWMFDSLKWPLDYFLKCWKPNANTFYVQVGDPYIDHAYWGRPEEMNISRPSYKVDTTNPGSDLAAETSAAFAASYLALKDIDSTYAAELLEASKTLYTYASSYLGTYSDHIPGNFYKSYSGYYDELCLGAVMLYKATGNETYLTVAAGYASNNLGNVEEFSWDQKSVLCQAILYNVTTDTALKAQYKNNVEYFLSYYINVVQTTPLGLKWKVQWGSLRYAANAAFVALVFADSSDISSTDKQDYLDFAASQIHYALGSTSRSFVTDFGNNPPVNPHHRSGSCPDIGTPCDWNFYNSNQDNQQTLIGALVGGPDQNDGYNDVRTDHIKNEVACDYNAGFQSAVAGLLHFKIRGETF